MFSTIVAKDFLTLSSSLQTNVVIVRSIQFPRPLSTRSLLFMIILSQYRHYRPITAALQDRLMAKFRNCFLALPELNLNYIEQRFETLVSKGNRDPGTGFTLSLLGVTKFKVKQVSKNCMDIF